MDPGTMIALIQMAQAAHSSLSGGGNSPERLPTMTRRQEKLQSGIWDQLEKMMAPGGAYGKGMGILEQYLDPNSSIYKNFEQPYINEFEQKTIPGIAEQFAGAGALGSSGFGQSLSTAGANLQQNVAAMKTGMQRQSINDIFGQFNALMNPAFKERFAYQDVAPSGLQGFIQNLNPNMFSGMGGGGGNQSSTAANPGGQYGGMQNARYVPPGYPIA